MFCLQLSCLFWAILFNVPKLGWATMIGSHPFGWTPIWDALAGSRALIQSCRPDSELPAWPLSKIDHILQPALTTLFLAIDQVNSITAHIANPINLLLDDGAWNNITWNEQKEEELIKKLHENIEEFEQQYAKAFTKENYIGMLAALRQSSMHLQLNHVYDKITFQHCFLSLQAFLFRPPNQQPRDCHFSVVIFL